MEVKTHRPANTLTFLPLHENREFTKDCGDLLNEEWPRSDVARSNILERSCDSLPCSLLLVDSDTNKLLGHARICKVFDDSNACYVESVIIKKDSRGCGYGRLLMQKIEDYCKRRGFTKVVLRTHDKQDFYEHLGYSLCSPVLYSNCKANGLQEHMLQKFSKCTITPQKSTSLSSCTKPETNNSCCKDPKSDVSGVPYTDITDVKKMPEICTDIKDVPTPPPPPPPPTNSAKEFTTCDECCNVWMNKSI